jgi:hypothetical protein
MDCVCPASLRGHICVPHEPTGTVALAPSQCNSPKEPLARMHQMVTKKADVGYIVHTQYYTLTSFGKSSTTVELVHTQSGSAAVHDTAVARASVNCSNHFVFRSRTTKALKADANTNYRSLNGTYTAIPRWRAVAGVGEAGHNSEPLC